MEPTDNSLKKFISILRKVSRISGIIILVLFFILELRKGVGNPASFDPVDRFIFIGNLIFYVGFALAWKRENIGGVLLIFGYCLFAALNRTFWLGGIYTAFPILGAAFIICWLHSMKMRNNHNN
jgi:hypothetical protein